MRLRVLDCDLRIESRDEDVLGLLAAVYGGMGGREISAVARAGLRYTVGRERASGDLYILPPRGGRPLRTSDAGEFLFLFDKDLTVRLQRLRPDLYFVHAAVLEAPGGKALMLVAPSGVGKSTAAWGLSHLGFRYLSDELAPVDMRSLAVRPYPRALCLKSEPPGGHRLPSGTVRTLGSFHVPPASLPGGRAAPGPIPLGAIVFLRYPRAGHAPAAWPVSAAQAAARLYANALNPLAHPADGLDAAVEIARRARCLELRAGELRATCALINLCLSRRELVGCGGSEAQDVSPAESLQHVSAV
jgi:hypothetical protein